MRIKPIFLVFGISALCGAASLFAQEKGDKWVLFANTSNRKIFYDSTSVHKIEGAYYFWTKEFPTSDSLVSSREGFIQTFGEPQFAKYDHTLARMKLDCYKEKFGITKLVYYDKEGNIILSPPMPPNIEDMWEDIIPDTPSSVLQKIICKKER